MTMREVNNNLAANPGIQPVAKPVEKVEVAAAPVAETPAKEINEIPNNPAVSATVKADTIAQDLKVLEQVGPAKTEAAMNIGDALQQKLEQSGIAPVDAIGQAVNVAAAAAQELK